MTCTWSLSLLQFFPASILELAGVFDAIGEELASQY